MLHHYFRKVLFNVLSVCICAGLTNPVLADQNRPEIDYTTPYVQGLSKAGAVFSGWWGTISDHAGADADVNLIAINFSEIEDPDDLNSAVLLALCSDGNFFVAYFPRQLESDGNIEKEKPRREAVNEEAVDAIDWVTGREAEKYWEVTSRADGKLTDTRRWRRTSEENGVFLRGREAIDYVSDFNARDQLKVTLPTERGKVSNTFRMAGGRTVLHSMLEKCN